MNFSIPLTSHTSPERHRPDANSGNTETVTGHSKRTMNEDGTAAAPKFGVRDHAATIGRRSRGDPRMRRALSAKLADPETSALDALLAGGFEFPNLGKAGMTDHTLTDSENVSLGQRKNQLSRRVRQEKRKMIDASRHPKRQPQDEIAINDAKRQKVEFNQPNANTADKNDGKITPSISSGTDAAGGALSLASIVPPHLLPGKPSTTSCTSLQTTFPLAHSSHAFASRSSNNQIGRNHAETGTDAKRQKVEFNQPIADIADTNDGKITPSISFGTDVPGNALNFASIHPPHQLPGKLKTTSCANHPSYVVGGTTPSTDSSGHLQKQLGEKHAFNDAKRQKVEFNQPNANIEGKNYDKVTPSTCFSEPGSTLAPSIYPRSPHLPQYIDQSATSRCTTVEHATLPSTHSRSHAVSLISGTCTALSTRQSAHVSGTVSSLPSPDKRTSTTATQQHYIHARAPGHSHSTIPTNNHDNLDFDLERLAAVMGIEWES